MAGIMATRSAWLCGVCGSENTNGSDAAPVCWACGRSKPRIDWPRRLRRIGAIALGVALQIGAGILIWLHPPGTSAWSWTLYLGMGLVGFLHIFIGGEMLRRDLRRSDSEPEPAFSAWSLAFQDHRCPTCEQSISRAIDRGERRCPGCNAPFSVRDLGWHHADPAGEPASLGPGEMRIRGRRLVAGVVVVTIIGIIGIAAMVLAFAPLGP